jgi:hypothetical protein
MKRFLVIFIVAIFLNGCSAYKGINLFSLKIGMSKTETIAAIGKKPDNLIGAKKFDDGMVEVIQYTKYNPYAMTVEVQEQYWLYYLDDKLVQWGRPGDWQKEADQIYEIRKR